MNCGPKTTRCEYLTTIQLAGSKPYVQLNPLLTKTAINLTMVIKTKERSGVLLYYGQSDHLAVELFHGRVRVREKILKTLIMYSLRVGELERRQPPGLNDVQLRGSQRRQAAHRRVALGREEPHHEGGWWSGQESDQPGIKGKS